MYDIFLLIATVAVTFIVATDIANRRWGKIQARDGLFVAIMEDVDGAEEYAIIHAGDYDEARAMGKQIAMPLGYILIGIEPADTVLASRFGGYATLNTVAGGGFDHETD